MNIKLDKTKALAKIYNEITKELKEETFNFKTDADTFKAAINDFITELDCNVLNCNKDLIISRLDKNFSENYPYFELNDFDDKAAELLSAYRNFSGLLFDCLMSYEGLQEYKELAEKEQKKNVAKPQQTSHKSTETITSIIFQALQYDLIQPTPKRAENDNGLYDLQIAVLESLHGFNFVCWLQENKKDIAKNYTFNNFCQYLKSHYQTVEAQKAAFEKEFESKKQYWQSVVFNNSKQNIIPAETLQALEKEKLITQNPLKWLKSKQLLGYFVEGMNEKYKLQHGQKKMIKPFEMLFNVTGLTSAINEYKNKTGQLPVGTEIIDNILK